MMATPDFGSRDATPPKMSPRGIPDRGSRSPAVARNEPSSTGTLKLNISLGKNPSVVHSGPFYLLKEPPEKEKVTGQSNLIIEYNLEHAYQKFNGKKVKEPLSSFLPNLPGIVDTVGDNDNSSLRSVIEKPPITGKEIEKLTVSQLAGFRLHPGPLPEQYRQLMMQPPAKKKLKKNKYDKDRVGLEPGCAAVGVGIPPTHLDPVNGNNSDQDRKKHKKKKDKDKKEKHKEKKHKEKKHKAE